jgi:alpha-tubulin suppressor-like RCC1 family protein
MLFAEVYERVDQAEDTLNVDFVDPQPRFAKVAAGDNHTIALDDQGDVWVVGANNQRQLGLYDDNWARRFAVKLDVENGAGGDSKSSVDAAFIVDVSARSNGSLALSDTGAAYFWGSAGTGWLNQFITPLGGGWESVSMGGRHILLCGTNGKVYAAGGNNFGQLGDGTRDDSEPIMEIAITVPPPATHFIQVAAGDNHSLALTADGRVFACGDNSNGQVGDGTTEGPVLRFTQVQKSPGIYINSIISIGAGARHSLAIDRR